MSQSAQPGQYERKKNPKIEHQHVSKYLNI